ncbi:hypothetical protein [Streptomyces sp. BE133]|uniref:hypothetical protein n=1 Tax=Streptomyces sp. BE133 TaxID=3002523 RepID=UPI002E76BF0E|nr:hypothetical protein [Streptomyces sp. BE133]
MDRGEFRTSDPYVTINQILDVIDGPGAHANTDAGDRPEAGTRMAVSAAEHELDPESGTLMDHAGALGVSRTVVRPAPGTDEPPPPVPATEQSSAAPWAGLRTGPSGPPVPDRPGPTRAPEQPDALHRTDRPARTEAPGPRQADRPARPPARPQ